jgi:hypothetical protein
MYRDVQQDKLPAFACKSSYKHKLTSFRGCHGVGIGSIVTTQREEALHPEKVE